MAHGFIGKPPIAGATRQLVEKPAGQQYKVQAPLAVRDPIVALWSFKQQCLA
jgi:hypothetical protein